MNNRILIPVLIFPLVVALIVGLFFVFRADDNVEPKDPDATDNGTIVDPEDIQHTTGNPVIEFDEGNEAYLDESIVSYLERMDQGVPSIDENGNYYLYEDGDVVYDCCSHSNPTSRSSVPMPVRTLNITSSPLQEKQKRKTTSRSSFCSART